MLQSAHLSLCVMYVERLVEAKTARREKKGSLERVRALTHLSTFLLLWSICNRTTTGHAHNATSCLFRHIPTLPTTFSFLQFQNVVVTTPLRHLLFHFFLLRILTGHVREEEAGFERKQNQIE